MYKFKSRRDPIIFYQQIELVNFTSIEMAFDFHGYELMLNIYKRTIIP